MPQTYWKYIVNNKDEKIQNQQNLISCIFIIMAMFQIFTFSN